MVHGQKTLLIPGGGFGALSCHEAKNNIKKAETLN